VDVGPGGVHLLLGLNHFYAGHLEEARTHTEEACKRYDPAQRYPGSLVDPLVAAKSNLALVLSQLGFADQALKLAKEVLVRASEIGRPYTLCDARSGAGAVYMVLREYEAGRQLAAEALELSVQEGTWAQDAVRVHLGWCLAQLGDAETGLATIRQGLNGMRQRGHGFNRLWCLALLAETCAKAGQTQEALSVVDTALAEAETKELLGETWIHRIKGDLLLARGAGSAQAEACYNRALALARRTNAKGSELQAAMSLARLWQREGRRAEAHELLSEIHGWFTEGFDTPDLREAKSLLDELS
jgi:adenylate cyclase